VGLSMNKEIVLRQAQDERLGYQFEKKLPLTLSVSKGDSGEN
jgi:hypothetical protein